MLNCFPQGRFTDHDALLDTYEALLDGIDTSIVKATAKRFMAGKVPGQSLTFPPSTAEFVKACRDEMAMREYRSRRPDSETFPPQRDPSLEQIERERADPEVQARIRKLVKGFLKPVGGDNA